MTTFYTLKEKYPRENSTILLFDDILKAVIAGRVEMTEYEREFLNGDVDFGETLGLTVLGNVYGKLLSEYSDDTKWCYLENALDDDVQENIWLLDYI